MHRIQKWLCINPILVQRLLGIIKVDRIVKQNPNQNHNHNADSHGAIYVVSRLDMISVQDNTIFFHVY